MAASKKTKADKLQDKALGNIAGQAKETADELNKSFRSVGETIKNSITNNLQGATQQMQALGNTMKGDLLDQAKRLGSYTADLGKNVQALNKGLLTSTDLEERLEAVEIKRKQLASELVDAARRGVLTTRQSRDLLTQINKQSQQQKVTLQEQVRLGKLLEKQRDLQAKIQDAVTEKMGKYGKAVQALTKIPIVGQLIDSEKVMKRMEETAKRTGSSWKTIGAGISETFKSMGDTLTNPIFLIGGMIGLLKTLIKLATEYEQKQFDAARDLGVSVQRGKQLRDHFVNLSFANVQLGLTADELQKAYGVIQDEMGIIVKQSDEFNVTTAQIMRRTGATAESMTTLQYAALKTGKSLQGAYQSIVGSAKAMGARLKLDMSEKQILEGISKVSATVLSNFHGNYSQLAKAVVEAKKLGTTLDKINATQDQFLDFETSISKQFEAQVLTGEELDLSAARQLAENHDTVGLMKEMNKLIGDRVAWDKLGTIEQQSKAEALGMSRDMLNEMFVTQEKTRLLGAAAGEDLKTQYDYLVKHHATQKQIEDTLGAQAVQSMQQASTAERMNVLMEGIKNTIAQMAQAILPLVNSVLLWLSKTENLKQVLKVIAGVIGGIVAYSITLKVLGAAQAMTQNQLLRTMVQQNVAIQTALMKQGLLTEEQIVGAGAAVTAGSSYLGPGAIAVGTAAIAALLAYLGTGSALGSGAQAENTGQGGIGPGAGGGGAATLSAPSIPTAVASSTSTTTPTISSGAISNANAGGSGANITANLVVDGQTLASTMIKYIPRDHSNSMDNNTGVS